MKDDQEVNSKECKKASPPPSTRSNSGGQIIDGDDVESCPGSLRIGCLQQQQTESDGPSFSQKPATPLTQSRYCESQGDLPLHSGGRHQPDFPSAAHSELPRPSLRHAVSRGDRPVSSPRRSFLSQIRGTLQETWRAVGLPSSRRRSRQVADALSVESGMMVDGDKAEKDVETASYFTGEDTKAKAFATRPSAWILTPMASSVTSMGGTYARLQESSDQQELHGSQPEPIVNPPAPRSVSRPGAFCLRPGDNRMRPAGTRRSSFSSLQSGDAPSIVYSTSHNSINPDFLNRNDLFRQDSATFFVPRANVIDDASVTPDPIALFDVYHASPLDTSVSLESLAPEDAVILNRRVVKCFVLSIFFILLSLGSALSIAMGANSGKNKETLPPRPAAPSGAIPMVSVSETGLSAMDTLPDMAIDYDYSVSSGSNVLPSLDAVLDTEKTILPETSGPSSMTKSSFSPTMSPTNGPTDSPTTQIPTGGPTYSPTTISPTGGPTGGPSYSPTARATTGAPSQAPSTVDKINGFITLTSSPTFFSGQLQSYAIAPAAVTRQPINTPSIHPSMDNPTTQPSSRQPSDTPSLQPSLKPPQAPSGKPSLAPTSKPTPEPTPEPTIEPTLPPTPAPVPVPFMDDSIILTPEPTSPPTRRSQTTNGGASNGANNANDSQQQEQAEAQAGNNENPVSLAIENPTPAPTQRGVSVSTVTATASASISASDEIELETQSNANGNTESNGSSQTDSQGDNNDGNDNQGSLSNGSTQSDSQGSNNNQDESQDNSSNGSNNGGINEDNSSNGSSNSGSQGSNNNQGASEDEGGEGDKEGSNKDKDDEKEDKDQGSFNNGSSNSGSDKDKDGEKEGKDQGSTNNESSNSGSQGGKGDEKEGKDQGSSNNGSSNSSSQGDKEDKGGDKGGNKGDNKK